MTDYFFTSRKSGIRSRVTWFFTSNEKGMVVSKKIRRLKGNYLTTGGGIGVKRFAYSTVSLNVRTGCPSVGLTGIIRSRYTPAGSVW